MIAALTLFLLLLEQRFVNCTLVNCSLVSCGHGAALLFIIVDDLSPRNFVAMFVESVISHAAVGFFLAMYGLLKLSDTVHLVLSTLSLFLPSRPPLRGIVRKKSFVIVENHALCLCMFIWRLSMALSILCTL